EALLALGVQPAAGRILASEDGRAASSRVVMLSHGLWTRRFGRDRAIVGQRLQLNDETYTVVGVLPQDFVLPNAEVELAAPLVFETDPRREERGSNFIRAFGRLAPSATVAQAASELDGINRRLRELYPEANAKKTAPRVLPLRAELVG